MKRNIKFVLVGIFILSFDGLSKVRTVYTNDQRMEIVSLKIGKSTLLSFSSKPKKAIVGNPDLLEMEFTGNELTIRPKGMVETNLFIYTKERIFGFLIRVVLVGEYDDFVHVKWKYRYRYRLIEKTGVQIKSNNP